MDRSALDRYTGRRDTEPVAAEVKDNEAVEDIGAFGWLRGMRARVTMLDLRMRNGNRIAIAYSWIERIDFDPSVGIVITAGRQRVQIAGQNLNIEVKVGVRLYEGLASQRVLWVREGGSVQCFVDMSASVCSVDKITSS